MRCCEQLLDPLKGRFKPFVIVTSFCTIIIGALLIYWLKIRVQNFDVPPLSNEQAKQYLVKNGYVPLMKISDNNDENELQNEISNFQKLYELDETGKLDEETRKFMARPQCGVPDIYVYELGASRAWKKKHLTYRFEKITDDLPDLIVRTALKHAFAIWSEYIPLDFSESQLNADIIIRFGGEKHNCLYPFDGRGMVLAHVLGLVNGNLHFDDDENWVYMDDRIAHDEYVDLLSVAIHEVGHVLGLDHDFDKDSIMFSMYNKPIDFFGNYKEPKLSENDIKRIQGLYGVRGAGTGSDEDVKYTTTTRYTFASTSIHTTEHTTRQSILTTQYTTPYYPTHSRPPTTTQMPQIECPHHVDAFVNGPEEISYIFLNQYIYELRRNRIIKKQYISDVFREIYSTVTAGYYNEKTHTYILFTKENKVYAYHHRRNRDGVRLDAYYPKEWPIVISDVDGSERSLFEPAGALWFFDEDRIETASGTDLSNQAVIFSGSNHIFLYVEHENQLKLFPHSTVEHHFPNFPRYVKGGFIAYENGVTFLTLFTSNSVHLYDIKKKESVGHAINLHKYLSC